MAVEADGVPAAGGGTPLVEDAALGPAGRLLCDDAPAWLMGVVRLVERLRINFPWTTILSFDFLRSRVSISVGKVGISISQFDKYTSGNEGDDLPSPPASRSMTLPILTLTTPRMTTHTKVKKA